MSDKLSARTGGEILVDQLVIQGVDQAFCGQEESCLAILAALYETSIDLITCRHEGAASIMAEASGKLTHKPGICFVMGESALINAMSGIHIAQHDSTPMIVFVGMMNRNRSTNEADQAFDYRALLSDQVKWVTEIEDAARIPEIVGRAFHLAISGRAGPVVIGLLEEMLLERVVVSDSNVIMPVAISPSMNDMAQFEHLLSSATEPLIILGGSGWDSESVSRVADFAGKYLVPVAVEFRRQMLFSTAHEAFIGEVGLGINPYLRQRILNADLVIVLGGQFSEIASQNYRLLRIPVPQQRLIHIHADINELYRFYQPDLAINADPVTFTKALSVLKLKNTWPNILHTDREAYLQWSDPENISPTGRLQMGEVMAFLNRTLPSEAILTYGNDHGDGDFTSWINRFYHFSAFGTQLAPTLGVREEDSREHDDGGYGLPAAIAAKRRYPNRVVVCFTDERDFRMSWEAFATAVQYKIPVIVILFDKAIFGTKRMFQSFAGSISGKSAGDHSLPA